MRDQGVLDLVGKHGGVWKSATSSAMCGGYKERPSPRRCLSVAGVSSGLALLLEGSEGSGCDESHRLGAVEGPLVLEVIRGCDRIGMQCRREGISTGKRCASQRVGRVFLRACTLLRHEPSIFSREHWQYP